ncbi:hypothetical protein [Elizabethkingia anophelis]|uniref:hypothetical protein n=1 Tax=Elizabethkingia anophelis TaxID=1117645 RepID=UPI001F5B2083|nr:hypothetical protein [Elizabethkingia anophelis]
MNKNLLITSLWGILALSTLSSCRTEDNITQQKQEKDMRFAVFIPQSGKTVNYADGFAHLMKRYDSIHKTNLSGMNNAPVISHLNASIDKNNLSSQSGETFVAFNIRSQTVTEENGNKWVVFPEVTNGKIANLVVGFLSEKETKVHYYLASKESELYKNNISLFQSSLERYMKRINKLNLNASINPVSYVKETEIEEVVITVPKKNLDPRESFGGMNPAYNSGGGSCSDYGGCINDYYAPGGGGGSTSKSGADINYDKLKDFPCAYALAQQLTNEKIGGDLARLLKETFGANERVNISFQTSDNKFLGEKVTGGFRFTGDANNFNGTVYLNKDRLSNATQDFLLSTMYHEVLHGYLNYERSRIGETEFNNRYPAMESYDVKFGDGTTMKKFLFIGTDQNHNRMGPFINGIKQAVLNFDPSYPSDRAEALAMGGIIAESSLPAGYRSIGPHEADGSTAALGKRCSN